MAYQRGRLKRGARPSYLQASLGTVRWKRIDIVARLKTLSAVVLHSTVVGHALEGYRCMCPVLSHMFPVLSVRVVNLLHH